MYLLLINMVLMSSITLLKMFYYVFVLVYITLPHQAHASQDNNILSLSDAIAIAHKHDVWLQQSKLIEQGLTTLSSGADALPDPTISVAN